MMTRTRGQPLGQSLVEIYIRGERKPVIYIEIYSLHHNGHTRVLSRKNGASDNSASILAKIHTCFILRRAPRNDDTRRGASLMYLQSIL